MHIKKNDTVIVIAGKDKGKKGKVLQVFPAKERVIVEGVNMVTKHQKPSATVQQGGIIHQEAAVHVSNVMLWDPKEKVGTRVKHTILEDGKKVRVSVKSGEILD
ncbi:50S ribosomal protein L24 [Helicovermis profundi]|uniref:Large ribosomal subunit protein uL24 n=1 Tax=Helicovermis profundi TaxID=3065157 RepID=A0AAU9E5X3_9FIRM|nr:50S ribosomal protein L24 [Clostridia bacterium S502]